MELTLSGPSGELRAGYAVAASLADWRLQTVGPSLYRLTARVERVAPVLLSLPLRAQLRLPAGPTWGFAVESAEVAGERLEAGLSGDPMTGG